MNRLTLLIVTTVLSATASGTAVSLVEQSPDGREILRDRQARHRIESDEHVSELVVTAKNGRQRHREWISYRLGWGRDANRLIRFTGPADVRGVAYLLRQREGRAPDEWLYLPSMKRERRIVAGDRDTAFAGTDFAFEDLEEFDEADYEVARLPDRTIAGHPAYAIELVPRRRSSYAKKVLSLRKDNLCTLTVEYFRKSDPGLSKRLTFSNYQQVQGRWIAMTVEMADLVKGSRTTLALRDVVLGRQQPADRYTIQNLLRDTSGGGGGLMLSRVGPARLDARQNRSGHSPAPLPRLGSFRVTGSVGTLTSLYTGVTSRRDPRAEQWTTLRVTAAGSLGGVHFRAVVRAEDTTSSKLGPVAFDPADRALRRSPLGVHEVSVTVPIRSGIDFQVGRVPLSWGLSDGYSPFDAFVPRDTTDPLVEQRLPVWAMVLSGERRGIRAELVLAPTTTPWRLPAMDGRHSPLSRDNIFLLDAPSPVPQRGFGSLRVSGSAGAWDVAGWVRTGVRAAPLLRPRRDLEEIREDGIFVPVERHYPDETAIGIEIARPIEAWVVRSEIALMRPEDGSGDMTVWTVGGSRLIRHGTFTGTIALNLGEPADLLSGFVIDRALLPAVILAVRQHESWGRWEAGWLSTLRWIGGVLRLEAVKTLSPALELVAGLDVPHGAILSPARAFAGTTRARVGVTWSW